MRKLRTKIQPEISREQSGFVEGEDTSNATYIFQKPLKRATVVNTTNLYLWLTDYTKRIWQRANKGITLLIHY